MSLASIATVEAFLPGELIIFLTSFSKTLPGAQTALSLTLPCLQYLLIINGMQSYTWAVALCTLRISTTIRA